MAARSAGLKARTVEAGGRPVHLYEGGDGPPLVLLHGMADGKNSFVAAAELTEAHRAVLPDMPAHGENARDISADLSIAGQVAHVDALVTAPGLDRFALCGNSMGGHVAAAYAIAHPHRVTELVLVDAPMARVVTSPPGVPGPVKDELIRRADAGFDTVNAAARAVRDGAGYDLTDRAGGIVAPTLIAWGEEDAVVPREVAGRHASLVPDARLLTLPGPGHSPRVERPGEVGRPIAVFVAD